MKLSLGALIQSLSLDLGTIRLNCCHLSPGGARLDGGGRKQLINPTCVRQLEFVS